MRAWSVLFLAACSFEHGELPGTTRADAMGDGDAPPGCASFSSQLDTCALTASDGDLTLSGENTYDTATGMLTAGTTPVAVSRMQLAGKAGPIDVLLVRDFHMLANASLRATGPVPLAVLAFRRITIDAGAIIDVGAGGAGARTSCTGGAINGVSDNGGAGGGGGGGFGAVGGNGGNGDADGTTQGPGGPGGAMATAPEGPLGGCPGGKGGDGADDGGTGGPAGGAIYLVAAERIELAAGAGINAGGGGGAGGERTDFSFGDAGGGGGGSGGTIMIESAIVRSAGVLAANGGGGGEGSGGNRSGNPGSPGALAAMPASGGSGNSGTGSDGAQGGAQLAPAGASVLAVENGGGGGGGGSVGYIIVQSADAMIAVASPNAI